MLKVWTIKISHQSKNRLDSIRYIMLLQVVKLHSVKIYG